MGASDNVSPGQFQQGRLFSEEHEAELDTGLRQNMGDRLMDALPGDRGDRTFRNRIPHAWKGATRADFHEMEHVAPTVNQTPGDYRTPSYDIAGHTINMGDSESVSTLAHEMGHAVHIQGRGPQLQFESSFGIHAGPEMRPIAELEGVADGYADRLTGHDKFPGYRGSPESREWGDEGQEVYESDRAATREGNMPPLTRYSEQAKRQYSELSNVQGKLL